MKKIIALTSVLALAACGNAGISSEQIAQHDADFAGCERVDTTKTHLVYKCPSNMEWIVNVKKSEPTALFQTGGGLIWDDVNADTEHTYVEVVHGKFGAGVCKEDFHYRTMVKPFNRETREPFAVVGCK